ncbi:uncharacterized protein LOC142337555 [Convolutriloba macropyga]|uniref:uncharacterized protein LOC142337555 n=1 Tax=Convolutriloba macropyga TaxID=536237 RepID=UPI003F51E27E
MGRSKSRSGSSSPERFQEENCMFDPVSKGFRIHLADLPDNPDEEELQREFARYGPLSEKPWVARASPCFGFVVFKYRDDAWDACHKMDNKLVCGARIRTSFALPRNQGRAAGGPGVPRCYQCGRFGHYSRECKPKVTRAVRDDSSSSEERSPSRTPEREKRHSYDRRSRSRSGRRSRSRSRSRGGGGGGRNNDSRGGGGGRRYRNSPPQRSRSRSGGPQGGRNSYQPNGSSSGGNYGSSSGGGGRRDGKPEYDQGGYSRNDMKEYSRGFGYKSRSRSRDRRDNRDNYEASRGDSKRGSKRGYSPRYH